MKAGELFAGYGGLALAVETVFNAETAWVAEWDEAPSKILAHHFPDTPNHRDVTTVDWANIEKVQIISGGSPCQDISAAGARRGMTEGTRSNLWVAMREAIATQKPDLVVWENVRGAFSATATSNMEPCEGCMGGALDGEPVLRALGRVLGDLSTLGYDAQWRTIRVSDIGGAHQRARVFILAHHRDSYTFRERWEQGGARPHQDNQLANNSRDLAERATSGNTSQPAQKIKLFLPTPVASPSGNTPEEHLRKKPGRNQVTDLSIIAAHNLFPTGGKTLPTPNTMDSLDWREGEARKRAVNRGRDTDTGKLTGNLREEVHFNFGEYTPVIERWEAIIGRQSPPAATPSKTGRPQLNPRFSEWLMGLPDGWVTSPQIGLTRAEQLKAIGNGVCPQQATTALAEMWANLQPTT